MSYFWDEEKDKFRRTVQFVVNGLTEGYYYEDVSDPGIFPVYKYVRSLGEYKMANVASSEKEAKAILKLSSGFTRG